MKRVNLVIGESHTNCIRMHNSKTPSEVTVIPAQNISTERFADKDNFKRNGVDVLSVDNLFLSLSGNFHNIFGLFEMPCPIYLINNSGMRVPKNIDGRVFVARNMLKAHFRAELRSIYNRMRHYKLLFGNARTHCICAPPPIGDDDYIRRNPQGFEEQIAQDAAFTPRELRLVFYNIQTEVYRAHSQKLEVEFIEPPRQALDPAGFLAEEFCARDATHGNEQYGRLVTEQILRRAGSFSAEAPLSGPS